MMVKLLAARRLYPQYMTTGSFFSLLGISPPFFSFSYLTTWFKPPLRLAVIPWKLLCGSRCKVVMLLRASADPICPMLP